MRRILLAGCAALCALVAGPVAGASADIAFKGSCSVTGISTFDKPLTGTQQDNAYTFDNGSPDGGKTPDGTKCTGVTLNGVSVPDGPAKVHVRGEHQQLSCAKSTGTGGQGTITLGNGVVVPFLLDIDGTLTEVNLTIHGLKSGSGSGHASFMKYAPPTAAVDCGPTGSGIKALGFEATNDNTAGEALVDPGQYPPPAGSSGPGTTPNPSPGSGSGPGSSGSQPSSGNPSRGSGGSKGKKGKKKKGKKKKGKKKKGRKKGRK
jgi:hypothetical protein